MSTSASKNKRKVTAVALGGKTMAINKAAAVLPSQCGSGPHPGNCHRDEKVFLSLYAYPIVVRQVGDVVNYYFKITNLTDEAVAGPIDFYISGSEEPIGEIDSLPANGFYDLLLTYTVNTEDITRRFIVATVWARRRLLGGLGCQLGNVAETVVSVEAIASDVGSLQFADPNLLITATDDCIDIQASVDIINLATLPVDSLLLDLAVIFGKTTPLSYFIDGLPSNKFINEQNKLRLAPGQTIGIGERFGLTVTNTDKTADLSGYCDETCESVALWRLLGKATNTTVLPWVGTTPNPNFG